MSTTSLLLLLPNSLFSSPTKPNTHHAFAYPPPRPISFLSTKRPPNLKSQGINIMVHCNNPSESDVGTDVECFVPYDSDPLVQPASFEIATEKEEEEDDGGSKILEWLLLVSPFFFWGTAMVAMKEVLPKTGPFFIASFRLIPAGALLVAFAAATGRKQPAGAFAWVSIALFAAVDAACFQGFLAQGLQRTSAGLGSVNSNLIPLLNLLRLRLAAGFHSEKFDLSRVSETT